MIAYSVLMSRQKYRLIHFRYLIVYKLAFECAMTIFELSKQFPVEERYSLIGQMRKSARSVCSNLAEAWRKRKYKPYFKNKLTDAMAGASETQAWLVFPLACNYIDGKIFYELDSSYLKIIAMVNSMDKKADTFCF